MTDDEKLQAKREAQAEQLKRDQSSALRRKECAWFEIQQGADPAWIAQKYGFPVEQMEHAARVSNERVAKRRGDETRGQPAEVHGEGLQPAPEGRSPGP